MFSLTSLSVFSLRGCSYYLYTPALFSCLGCCTLSEITHWVHIPGTGVSFVASHMQQHIPAGNDSGGVRVNWGFLRERGCDRKDALVLIIPVVTQTPRWPPQGIEVYFSPEIRREVTQISEWNLSYTVWTHLSKKKLSYTTLLQNMLSPLRIHVLEIKFHLLKWWWWLNSGVLCEMEKLFLHIFIFFGSTSQNGSVSTTVLQTMQKCCHFQNF